MVGTAERAPAAPGPARRARGVLVKDAAARRIARAWRASSCLAVA
ncbi:hypothetical protein [Sorangium sp. So ce1000]